ncbi:uncharacterized protein CcaverHIS019_0507070 [Cutaneotrichosporon cavernicola]|uniref:DUF1996 domain-containing protein n=1 Tax=Cutaneotrichosporon cavernicola TaxID=279322 RepID=A0AA48L6V1_9TREE|nr:uncharacterized protein CcaverHIS019_0507070 [Cutaneotrichosporon cavernicola]BEI93079.1 hypothetical protein CcaverHIS019_0507070 [Cutaneotrichosporon cavernicola]BEJ00856.1 hypothetical protein CcaverHIS631_0507130 [Cutaneotrichosporon cavernicola]
MFAALVTALGLAGSATAQALPDHTIITAISPIMMGRLDPIIDPGKIGSHVHTVMGASNFRSELSNPQEMLNAECTTAVVTADKSNYWTPTVYYMHDNGTFEAMPPFNTRIYYFTKNETNMNPFPPGLRMISGTSMSRDTSDIRMRGVQIHCGDQPDLFRPWLPNGTTHPNGCHSLHVGVRFPSCGLANGALDSENHFDHMTWPVESLDYGPEGPIYSPNGGLCPPSHPIKYPTIFMQSFYEFKENQGRPWRAGKNNVVFSNGDMLGPSFHGDFVNGWDPTVLTNFVKQCNMPNGAQDKPANCPAWAPSFNEQSSRSCAYQGMLPAEDIGLYRAIDKLPGCNPLWAADGPVTRQKCDSPEPGFAGPNRFIGIGNERRIPVYLPNAGNYTEMFINEDFPAWTGQWGGENNQKGTAGGITYGDTFGGARVQVSSDQDVANHVTFATDEVAGMGDTSVFRVDFPIKAESGTNQGAGLDSNATAAGLDNASVNASASAGAASSSASASASASVSGSAAPSASAPPVTSGKPVDTETKNGVSNESGVEELPGGALVAGHPDEGTAAAAPSASTSGSASASASTSASGESHHGGTRVYSSGPNGSGSGSGSGSSGGSGSGSGSGKKCNRKRRRSRH